MRYNKYLLLMLLLHLSIIFAGSSRAYALPIDLSYSVNTVSNLQRLYNYTYDKNTNLTSFTNRNGDTINYRYDELGRLYHKDYPSGNDITYQYDSASRLDSLSRGSQLTDYSYDSLGRVISVTNEGSRAISYEYYPNGLRKKLTYPNGLGYITYNYDELNRLTDIKDPAGQGIAHYTYNALNLRETMQYLNGITTSYTYDELSRLTAASNQLSTINYTYDTMWNRTSMTNEYGEYRYDYDSIYQLTSVIASGGEAISYNYDPVGSRTTGYTINNLNQYTAVGTTAYTYDNNGNLTSNGTQTYTYDYENRLTSVIASQGEAISYTYDPFNRRTQKNNNGTITNYLYDGADLLVEYNANWEPIRHYAYSDNIDEPITITNTNATYYYHADGLGSITHITDSNGNLVEKYQYDAYGKPIILDVSNQPLAISSVGNRFMFTAREYDHETGLYYYRARYYDSSIGRFLSVDPVGYLFGPNLYTYVNNNPVNVVDPFGLAWKYKRPLESDTAQGIAGGIYGDFGGGRLHHEGFVYENGTTSGYFGDSIVKSDAADSSLMNQMQEFGPKLDDSLLRQAEQNVANDWNQGVNPNPPDYNLLNRNCQDYVEAVMEEYKRLLEEARKKKKEGKCK